jgi:hypothetical protein
VRANRVFACENPDAAKPASSTRWQDSQAAPRSPRCASTWQLAQAVPIDLKRHAPIAAGGAEAVPVGRPATRQTCGRAWPPWQAAHEAPWCAPLKNGASAAGCAYPATGLKAAVPWHDWHAPPASPLCTSAWHAAQSLDSPPNSTGRSV